MALIISMIKIIIEKVLMVSVMKLMKMLIVVLVVFEVMPSWFIQISIRTVDL